MLAPWKKSYDKTRQHIKKQRHYSANKGLSIQSYVLFWFCFVLSHQLWMWELDYKESWVPKNWYFWTVVFEKTLQSPLELNKIQSVHPEGNQSWIFIGSTDVEAEAPVLWPPYAKYWLLRKDPMLGRIEGRRRRGQQRVKLMVGITNSMDIS